MQSGLDFFGSRMLDDWFIRYITLRARAPELVQGLSARPDEFDLIPVPRGIVRQIEADLASLSAADALEAAARAGVAGGVFAFGPKGGGASFGFGFLDPGAAGQWATRPPSELVQGADQLEKVKHYGALVDLIRQFGRAVEAGDRARLAAVLSDDYQDAVGRSRDQLAEAAARLFGVTEDRRLIFVHIEQLEVVGPRMAGIVTGAWEARVADEPEGAAKEAPFKSEYFKLEFVFTRDRKGEWKISSVRQV